MNGKEFAARLFFVGTVGVTSYVLRNVDFPALNDLMTRNVLLVSTLNPKKYAVNSTSFDPKLFQNNYLSPPVLFDTTESRTTPSGREQSSRLKYVPWSPAELSTDEGINLERLCGKLKVSETQEITELNVPLRWPSIGMVSQYFNRYHSGIDILSQTNPMGRSVLPAARGVVVYTQESDLSYGNLVVVNHNNELLTLYAHLLDINVQEGEEVYDDTILGKVGSTGRSTGPHLHFGILQRNEDGCVYSNPFLFLP